MNILVKILATVFIFIIIFLVFPPTRKFLLSLINNTPPKSTSNTSRTVYPAGKDNEKYAIHSFIHANYPTDAKKYLFDAAARTGKKLIRFDFPLSIIEPNEDKYEWRQIDENVQMAEEKGLHIVGTLGYSAPWISKSNASNKFQGPIDPLEYDKYADYVKQTVRRYPQVTYWELWNEPNNKGLYDNNPSEFASLMKVMYQSIKEVNPQAQVLFPGVIFDMQKDFEWVKSVLTYNQNSGSNYYDIANVHIRGTADNSKNDTKIAIDGFNQYGKKNAPFWITEFAYPADPKYQRDNNYKGKGKEGGEEAQAKYYQEFLPILIDMKVDKIFVTLRDIEKENPICFFNSSQFCSEGLVTFSKNNASGTDRPSMKVFQDL